MTSQSVKGNVFPHIKKTLIGWNQEQITKWDDKDQINSEVKKWFSAKFRKHGKKELGDIQSKMPVKKIGVLSPRLYAGHGTAAVGFHMIANAVLTRTSISMRFYSMRQNNRITSASTFKVEKMGFCQRIEKQKRRGQDVCTKKNMEIKYHIVPRDQRPKKDRLILMTDFSIKPFALINSIQFFIAADNKTQSSAISEFLDRASFSNDRRILASISSIFNTISIVSSISKQ